MNTITLPELNEGEIYAGILLNESGAPQHHLILLPGDNNKANRQTQIDWAKSIVRLGKKLTEKAIATKGETNATSPSKNR